MTLGLPNGFFRMASLFSLKLQNTMDSIQKERLEKVSIEELKIYFPKETRIIDTLASYGYTTLRQLFEVSDSDLIKIPYFGGVRIRKIKIIKDSIERNVDRYLNAEEDTNIHELPSNYDRSLGLSKNLRNAIVEYAKIIKDNLDNITKPKQRNSFSLKANILKQYYIEGKSSDEIARNERYTQAYIDIKRNECISEIIGGGVFFKNYRLNQDLLDIKQAIQDECLFDPIEKFMKYAGNEGVPLYSELGYETVKLIDTQILIPKKAKRTYTDIWRIIRKILCDNPLPTDKDEIKQQIISNETLLNIIYDDTFIEKILNSDCFIEAKGQNLIQIKNKYLNNDAQRIARIVYESDSEITTAAIKQRYKEIYGRTIDQVQGSAKQYGISCQGRQFWYYGQPRVPLTTKVTEYAEEHKEFYYDKIMKYIEEEKYIIDNPQTFRTYITKVCATDNDNSNHFCHKDYVDEYPRYKWKIPRQSGRANWFFNEIRSILGNSESLPFQEMKDKLEERAQTDGYYDVKRRIQYDRMVSFCGEDKPFIIRDGNVCINREVYDNTDFDIIGLPGENYAFFKQIRSLVANEVKKKEDGRVRLTDIIALVNNNINDSLARNTIIRAIEDSKHRFVPIDLKIVNDNGVLYVQWNGEMVEPEPVFEVTFREETPNTEEVIEIKEKIARPSISYRQVVNWDELNRALKKELSFYGRWMDEEDIALNDAIDGFIDYLKESPNENLNRILPQDMYEYWFASTDSYDRYRYLTDLLFMFEGLLTQLYYDQNGKRPLVHGLSNLAELFDGLPYLLLSSRDAKGFNRIASNLHYKRNKIAHGDHLELSSVEMAQSITNYVALYVYIFAKYYPKQSILYKSK